MMRYFVSAGVLVAMIGGAEAAAKCPPGQIYRVTKKICVDKSAAIRAGIIVSNQKAARAKTKRENAKRAKIDENLSTGSLAANKAGGDQGAPKARAHQNPTAKAFAGMDKHTPLAGPSPVSRGLVFIGSANATFGALLDPWSGDPAPMSQFSLSLTAQD